MRFDIDQQTRASNQLLWSMENKMAEEAVMMDEIEVLLRVMRDNLAPSCATSETQVWRVRERVRRVPCLICV